MFYTSVGVVGFRGAACCLGVREFREEFWGFHLGCFECSDAPMVLGGTGTIHQGAIGGLGVLLVLVDEDHLATRGSGTPLDRRGGFGCHVRVRHIRHFRISDVWFRGC